MSRIEYDDRSQWDDVDGGLRAGRWFAHVRSAMTGRPGQQALRELESALVALPAKRLIEEELCTAEGEVCALGALARYKGVPDSEMLDSLDEGASVISDWATEKMGLSYTLAWMIQDGNDAGIRRCSPEDRYEFMLSWTREWLRDGLLAYNRYREESLP